MPCLNPATDFDRYDNHVDRCAPAIAVNPVGNVAARDLLVVPSVATVVGSIHAAEAGASVAEDSASAAEHSYPMPHKAQDPQEPQALAWARWQVSLWVLDQEAGPGAPVCLLQQACQAHIQAGLGWARLVAPKSGNLVDAPASPSPYPQ